MNFIWWAQPLCNLHLDTNPNLAEEAFIEFQPVGSSSKAVDRSFMRG